MTNYTENVDFEFLSGMGIHCIMHQPWQIGLLFPDWDKGKFVWYPQKGTLMVEVFGGNISKLGEYHDSEDMYNAMRAYLRV